MSKPLCHMHNMQLDHHAGPDRDNVFIRHLSGLSGYPLRTGQPRTNVRLCPVYPVCPARVMGPYLLQWTSSYTGEVVASGEVTVNLCGREEGWFRFQASSLDQWITLSSRPRYYGGRQWYFVPGDERAGVCALETTRRKSILQPPNVGTADRRIQIAIPGARRSRAGRAGKDQIAAVLDWPP
jgi:hypothetical protein